VKVNILGIRGLPAAHGGFETFAAKLAPYLIDRGHEVVVYCQEDSGPFERWEDEWQGIKRVHFRPRSGGSLGTIEFDLKCVIDVLHDKSSIDLVLGYNTGIFTLILRAKKRKIAINMDGIEWKRAKWGLIAKSWFYINEIFAANFCSIPIADHPEIARHVDKRCLKKSVMIPYGAEKVLSGNEKTIKALGLEPNNFFVSIARIEPENSILEIVCAFKQAPSEAKLLVLGKLDDDNSYHRQVRAEATSNVIFAGAIYDAEKVASIRKFSRAYIHGHQVGGTNPSLVEALGAGSAVIAHDNRFNKWVCGEKQFFFSNISSLVEQLHFVWHNKESRKSASIAALTRFETAFRWEDILARYEKVLLSLK